jgi:hypothetical protein
MSWNFSSRLSPTSLVVSGLGFKFLTHFELMLACEINLWLNMFLCLYIYSFPIPLIEKIIFPSMCSFISIFYSFIHMCIHYLSHFYPLTPPRTLPFPFTPPRFQAEPVLPLSLILLKRIHKYNKEDRAFFSSWIKDSYKT